MAIALAEALPCLLVPLIAVVAVVIIVLAYKAEQKRREAFRQLAERLGLSYDPSSDYAFDDRYPRFECFHRGHGRRAFNLMRGPMPTASGDGESRGLRCILGDYEFKETHGSGKNRRTVTYRFGFVLVETPWLALPDTLVRREHLLDKMAGFLGFDDIDFESAEFSRSWMVKSSDKRFAYDLIDPRMMEFLMQPGSPMIDIGGSAVCVWHGQNARLEPEQLAGLLHWIQDFLARWPRVLVQRLNEGSGGDARRSEHG